MRKEKRLIKFDTRMQNEQKGIFLSHLHFTGNTVYCKIPRKHVDAFRGILLWSICESVLRFYINGNVRSFCRGHGRADVSFRRNVRGHGFLFYHDFLFCRDNDRVFFFFLFRDRGHDRDLLFYDRSMNVHVHGRGRYVREYGRYI